MILLNFAHPLTSKQRQQIEELTGQPLGNVYDLPVQFDDRQSFNQQFDRLMTGLPLSPEALQTEAVVVNLPSLNFIAAMLLAELHGRMGFFPPVLRLRPVNGSLPPQYEVAEVLNLQQVRSEARKKRFKSSENET